MDFDALVNEIVARVAAKVSAAETDCGSPCGEKPGLLILTQHHGEPCHAMLESEKLREHYRTDCALLKEYDCCLNDYEAVILYNLTNDALAKLASGACDTPYTCLASKAILSGKRIFIPTEEVELYHYAGTAPAAYYEMMEQKLNLLTASGAVICTQANLEQAILGGAAAPRTCASAPAKADAPCRVCETGVKELHITKRVITERDLFAASQSGVTRIHVGAKSILTDLARDYGKAHGIQVVRE